MYNYQMDQEENKPRSVLEYLKITPFIKEISTKDYSTFKKELTLETQGKAVEIDTTLDTDIYPAVISTIYSCVKELIVKLEDNSLVVVFSHIDEDLYIISKETSPIILDEMNRLIYIIKSRSSYKDIYLDKKTSIDLSLITKELNFDKNNDVIEQTVKILQKISENLEKNEEIDISGIAHPLIIMSVLCFLRPFAKKIVYLNKKGESIIIF